MVLISIWSPSAHKYKTTLSKESTKLSDHAEYLNTVQPSLVTFLSRCRSVGKKAHEFMTPFRGLGWGGGKRLSLSHHSILWLKNGPYNTGETNNFQNMPKRLHKQCAWRCISMLIHVDYINIALTVSDLKNHDEKIKTRNRRELKELEYVKSISLTRPSYNK